MIGGGDVEENVDWVWGDGDDFVVRVASYRRVERVGLR